jgi:hypothetical protein
MTSCVTGPGTGLMSFDSNGKSIRDSGVKGLITTFKDIKKPLVTRWFMFFNFDGTHERILEKQA